MNRTLLIALITALVVGATAVGATLVITDDDDPVATATPFPTPTLTATPGASPTGSPTASPTASATAAPQSTSSATSAPSATTAAPANSPPRIRAAKDVDCLDEVKFCSARDTIKVTGDKLTSGPTRDRTNSYSGAPTIKLTSNVWKPDKTNAGTGSEVGSIHLQVVIENTTDDTFVFNKRDIVLELYKDGKIYDTFSTTGAGFDMTPKGKMTGTFDRPITVDGTYAWQAKTWYYKK